MLEDVGDAVEDGARDVKDGVEDVLDGTDQNDGRTEKRIDDNKDGGNADTMNGATDNTGQRTRQDSRNCIFLIWTPAAVCRGAFLQRWQKMMKTQKRMGIFCGRTECFVEKI